MTKAGWLLFTAGTLFSALAMALFLYALWLGLNRQKWWPLGLIVAVWVTAMAAYSAWDGSARREMQRQRIDELGSRGSVPFGDRHHYILIRA